MKCMSLVITPTTAQYRVFLSEPKCIFALAICYKAFGSGKSSITLQSIISFEAIVGVITNNQVS